MLCMLYIPPRSTFHHTVLSGLFFPIGIVLIHVSVFRSTAKFASSVVPPIAVCDWVASFLYEISSKSLQKRYCWKAHSQDIDFIYSVENILLFDLNWIIWNFVYSSTNRNMLKIYNTQHKKLQKKIKSTRLWKVFFFIKHETDTEWNANLNHIFVKYLAGSQII